MQIQQRTLSGDVNKQNTDVLNRKPAAGYREQRMDKLGNMRQQIRLPVDEDTEALSPCECYPYHFVVLSNPLLLHIIRSISYFNYLYPLSYTIIISSH
jgi:hypothetical protein